MKVVFSSAVPSGSGDLQMPTHLASASASTLGGGRVGEGASVICSLFLHEPSQMWY